MAERGRSQGRVAVLTATGATTIALLAGVGGSIGASLTARLVRPGLAIVRGVDADDDLVTVHASGGDGDPVTGVGALLRDDGLVLTTRALTRGSLDIHVTMPGSGARYPAYLLGSDPATDAALLQLEPRR